MLLNLPAVPELPPIIPIISGIQPISINTIISTIHTADCLIQRSLPERKALTSAVTTRKKHPRNCQYTIPLLAISAVNIIAAIFFL